MRQNLVKKGVIGRSLGLKCLGPQTNAFFIRIAIFFQGVKVSKNFSFFRRTYRQISIQGMISFLLKSQVSTSQNMKQKLYETLTSPKIQTNGIILNNCID